MYPLDYYGKNSVPFIPILLLGLKMEHELKSQIEKCNGKNHFQVCFIKSKWSPTRRNLAVDYEDFCNLVESEQFKDSEVFADELSVYNSDDLTTLTKVTSSYLNRTFWLTVTGMRQNKIAPQKIQNAFENHGFYVPNLVNPLRNSLEIVKFAYPIIDGM